MNKLTLLLKSAEKARTAQRRAERAWKNAKQSGVIDVRRYHATHAAREKRELRRELLAELLALITPQA